MGIKECRTKAIEERRNKVYELFTSNPGVKFNGKDVCNKLGINIKDKSSIIRDIHVLMDKDDCLESYKDPVAANRGFIYHPKNKEIKMPKIQKNEPSNAAKNKEGYSDFTAGRAISKLEPLSIYPGGVYSAITNQGTTAMWLAIRGPFKSGFDGTEKVTCVPVVFNRNDNAVVYYGRNKGASIKVDPYEVATKPTKYFKSIVDELLPCDLDSVKKILSDFLDIPKEKEIKVVEKITPVKETSKDMELALANQKADIYKDVYEKLVDSLGSRTQPVLSKEA